MYVFFGLLKVKVNGGVRILLVYLRSTYGGVRILLVT